MGGDNSDVQELSGHLRAEASRYYGKYRGSVADNEDPLKLGRLLLEVPSLLGDQQLNWALPCFPFGGADQIGTYLIPPVGAAVWVEFEQGDLSYPIWTGTYWPGDTAPPATEVLKRVVRTPFGHTLEFDDTDGSEKLTLKHGGDGNPSAVFDEKGGITITDKKGSQIHLDAEGSQLIVKDANGNTITLSQSGTKVEDSNGHTVTFDASGATLKATQIVLDGMVMLGGSGGEPILKGQSFLQFFMTHMHPTGVGPSGPPIPQGEVSSLSTKVMTS
jgi:type VI secretion system (T6SS) baseplate-like injector VgrG